MGNKRAVGVRSFDVRVRATHTMVVKVTVANEEEAKLKANDPSTWEHEQQDELIDWEVVGEAKES